VFAIAKGQTPTITMTTSKAIGSSISLQVGASLDNTIIQVDFGDGVKVDKTINIAKNIC